MLVSKEQEVKKSGEGGSGLIEVMIALLIMLFLMVGVLQMFSMAFLVNLGSAARTDMTYKCQQVVENIRMVKYLRKNGLTIVNDPTATIPQTFVAGTYSLPTTASGNDFNFWGPQGADVLGEMKNSTYIPPPYTISYQIQDGGGAGFGAPNFWIITVTVVPNASGASHYMGAGVNKKRIDYVAQIPK